MVRAHQNSNNHTIKVRLGDEVRKFAIFNQEMTYNELELMMQRIFKGKITSKDQLTFKYKDQDDDMITLDNDEDLSFALNDQHLLNLVVYINSSTANAIKLRQELENIRHKVTNLINSIDTTSVDALKSNVIIECKTGMPNGHDFEPIRPPIPNEEEQRAAAREFDPMNQSQPPVPDHPPKDDAPSVYGMGQPPANFPPQQHFQQQQRLNSQTPVSEVSHNATVASEDQNEASPPQHNQAPPPPPATIQPSAQEIVPNAPPISGTATPVSQFGGSQHQAPPTPMQQQFQQHQQPPPPTPPVSSMAPPQQQQYGYGQMPPPMQQQQQHPQPPPGNQSFPPSSQQQFGGPPPQQQQHPMPPQYNYGQQQQQQQNQFPPGAGDAVPPPPRMSAPPMGGMPPMAAGGGNPFAARPGGMNPYMRAQFPPQQ